MKLEIREITAKQEAPYKAFFTQGLIGDEDNFRITPADNEREPFPTRGTADSFTLGAYQGEELQGVVSFAREGATREKLRHKGLIMRMYVSPAARGQKVGQQLMEAVIARVQRDTDIEQIVLTVAGQNHVAQNLYQKLGFVSFGLEPRAEKWKGRYLDEMSMVLFLDR